LSWPTNPSVICFFSGTVFEGQVTDWLRALAITLPVVVLEGDDRIVICMHKPGEVLTCSLLIRESLPLARTRFPLAAVRIYFAALRGAGGCFL
jgi:hypothetical protein